MSKKCYRCKGASDKKIGVMDNWIFVCKRCADQLMVSAVMCDYINKNVPKKKKK